MSDFQASASIQGRRYEEIVVATLTAVGWQIETTHAHVDGVEIDIVATDPLGVAWWIECKGSWQGNRPGARRSDTVKKAIADAWLLSITESPRPYMLITSHLPEPGTHPHSMLVRAREAGLFTQINETGAMLPFGAEDEE